METDTKTRDFQFEQELTENVLFHCMEISPMMVAKVNILPVLI